MKVDQAKLDAALREIGSSVQHMVASVQGARNLSEGKERFAAWKADIKKRYKAEALKRHPDRGGDEASFAKIAALPKMVDSLNIGYRPPPQPVLRRVVYRTYAQNIYTNSASTTSATDVYPPWPWGSSNG